jgi:hypothetical protein
VGEEEELGWGEGVMEEEEWGGGGGRKRVRRQKEWGRKRREAEIEG